MFKVCIHAFFINIHFEEAVIGSITVSNLPDARALMWLVGLLSCNSGIRHPYAWMYPTHLGSVDLVC